MNRTTKVILAVLGSVALVLLGVLAVRQALYPHELERNPPKLDGLKRAIMDEVHLEANVSTDADLGSEDQAEKVTVTFVFVPPTLDKGDVEHRVRDLVKAYMPKSRVVDVRFGDNMRTRPLDIEQRAPVQLPEGVRQGAPVSP